MMVWRDPAQEVSGFHILRYWVWTPVYRCFAQFSPGHYLI